MPNCLICRQWGTNNKNQWGFIKAFTSATNSVFKAGLQFYDCAIIFLILNRQTNRNFAKCQLSFQSTKCSSMNKAKCILLSVFLGSVISSCNGQKTFGTDELNSKQSIALSGVKGRIDHL